MPLDNLFANPQPQTCARNVIMAVQAFEWLKHETVILRFDTLAIV